MKIALSFQDREESMSDSCLKVDKSDPPSTIKGATILEPYDNLGHSSSPR